MPSVTQGLCVLSQGCWSTTEFLHLHCPGLLCAFQLPPACPHQNEDEQHRYHRKVCHTPDVSSEHLCARTHFVLTAVPRGRALLAPLYRERHVICPSSSWKQTRCSSPVYYPAGHQDGCPAVRHLVSVKKPLSHFKWGISQIHPW